MKPCVICGKVIKKKDSLMTIEYVCSEVCKSTRKSKLPRKLTVTTWQYWVQRGFSKSEAKKHVSKLQSERSPRTIEYWLKKGFTNFEAEQKVSKYQQKIGLKNLEKYSCIERQERTPFSEKYWIKKGYTSEQAKEILKNNSDGTSLKFYIKKYGDKQGQRLYEEMCNHRKINYTLEGYQKKYGVDKGKELWSKKYKNRHNSKKACEFFENLSSNLKNKYKIYTAKNENGEYGILNAEHNEYFFYDFVVPELKLCVEYNGDYWHCNPKKYDKLYEHKQSGLQAKEIWERDKLKHDTIQWERGIEVIVVWESDDPQEKINLIMEKVNEFEKNKNCQ